MGWRSHVPAPPAILAGLLIAPSLSLSEVFWSGRHWGRNHLQLLSATCLCWRGSWFCSETVVSETQPVPGRDQGSRAPGGSGEFDFGPVLPVGIFHFLRSNRSTHGGIKTWDNLVLKQQQQKTCTYNNQNVFTFWEKLDSPDLKFIFFGRDGWDLSVCVKSYGENWKKNYMETVILG